MEELETGGEAEDIPVDGEPGEGEAGQSDETGADSEHALKRMAIAATVFTR